MSDPKVYRYMPSTIAATDDGYTVDVVLDTRTGDVFPFANATEALAIADKLNTGRRRPEEFPKISPAVLAEFKMADVSTGVDE